MISCVAVASLSLKYLPQPSQYQYSILPSVVLVAAVAGKCFKLVWFFGSSSPYSPPQTVQTALCVQSAVPPWQFSTGLGLLAAHYFHIPVAVFLGGYNAIMFVVGALTLGKHFAVTTLISSFLFPFLLSQIQLVVTEPLTADPMLATVLGGLLIGAGIGLVIRAGSSTGGNDVPVLLLKKKLGIPLSVSMYGFDIVILLFQIPYSQLEKALYSIILIILYSMIADKASTMGKSRMQVRIISKDYQKITDAIKTQINRGVTLYHIAGGYTGEESCEVMTILTSRELNELSDLVTEIDPKAFMTIARVNEARGRGFSIGKMEP